MKKVKSFKWFNYDEKQNQEQIPPNTNYWAAHEDLSVTPRTHVTRLGG